MPCYTELNVTKVNYYIPKHATFVTERGGDVAKMCGEGGDVA